jgi:alkanesulfonate monooxygenase SsuD/methylene tetrahydromethanopterin reductase-like flavin-dependent oxidoreductase (luciferase family)
MPHSRLEFALAKESIRPLKIGLHIPNGAGIVSGGNYRWRDVLKMAKLAEEVGFDSVWVADHVLFRLEDAPTQGRWECWSILAGLAAATDRIQIGPLVSCMSFRNPAMLAKIAETVDEISDGRLILGLGAGWHEPEYVAYGYPFDHRVSRFEEGLAIVRSLLKTGHANIQGRFERAIDCELIPRGPRPGQIPIMIGSTSGRMLGLAAKYADLWNSNWITEPAELPPKRTLVDKACEVAGRDPATLGRSAGVLVSLPGRDGHWTFVRPLPSRPQEPEEIANLLRAVAREGVSHAQVWIDPSTPQGIEAFAPVLEMLDRRDC